MRKIPTIQTLGLIEYEKALAIQTHLQQKRIQNEIQDTILLLEHPTVITLGKRGKENDILFSKKELFNKQVQIVKTDRGGQVTLHSPGQLVCYFIVKLDTSLGALRSFLSYIEQSIIKTLNILGITSTNSTNNVGIWVEKRKIASIGISVNHRVTRHGFALNVNNNLDYFSYIIPCGLNNPLITNMEKELHKKQNIQSIIEVYTKVLQSMYK